MYVWMSHLNIFVLNIFLVTTSCFEHKFQPEDANATYEIRLYKVKKNNCQTETLLLNLTVDAELPHTVVKIPKNVIREGKYCLLRIRNDSTKHEVEVFFRIPRKKKSAFSYSSYSSYKCSKWCDRIIVHPDMERNRIHVEFVVHNKTSSCQYEKYQYWLCYNVSGPCKRSSLREGGLCQEYFSDENMFTFENVSKGAYCVRANAYGLGCRYNVCDSEYTNVILISDPFPVSVQTSPSSWKLYFLVCLAPLVLGINYVILRRSSKIAAVPNDGNPVSNLRSEFLWRFTPGELKNRPLMKLIYSRDSEKFICAVEALATFFTKVWHLQVMYDQNSLPEIHEQPYAWCMKMATVYCPHYNPDAKVAKGKLVIIESTGAVQKEEAIKNGEYPDANAESLTDELFSTILSFVMSLKNRHSVTDYCHVLVVQISESSTARLSLVPQVRYKIPDHLYELFLAVFGDDQIMLRDASESELLPKWTQTEEYRKLESCMKNVE